jgi:hypothetical protein
VTTTFYSTAASVKTRTGAKPEDLGLEDDAALDAFVEEVLGEVTDLLDRAMRKSYLEADPIPAGLNGIAADAASNALREMVATRQTPVVRIDDFVVRVIQSNIMTPDIVKRLKLYAAGGGVASIEMEQDWLAPLPDILTAASIQLDD